MNATDFSFFKSFLLDQKSSILNKTNEFKTEQAIERTHIPEEAEAASHDLSTNLSIHLHERQRMVLFQIDRALGKIDDGTYGQCESCGENISQGRLKASPLATLCVSCKEEQEDPRNFLQ